MMTMPRVAQQAAVIAVLSFGFSYSVHGGEPSAAVQLSDEAKYALTAIDGVPAQAQLEQLIPDTFDALKELATNAKGNGEPVPIPLRLRAIRAISLWPRNNDAREALKQVVVGNQGLVHGTNVLLVQAALEGLGRQVAPDDEPSVKTVSDSLNNSNRDIRIAAARSLRQIGYNNAALTALYIKQNSEQVESVRAAIIEAIQALSQTTP